MRRRRGLSADDARLWAGVARSAIPLKGKSFPELPEMPEPPARVPAAPPPPAAAAAGGTGPGRRGRSRRRLSQHPIERPTRKKLAKGRLAIEARIDLHEMTQARAHDALVGFLRQSQAMGLRHVLVITGRGSAFRLARRPAPGRAAVVFRGGVPAARLRLRQRRAASWRGGRALRARPQALVTPFGERVRALRKAKGVTQRDMAAALKVSSAYLSALEHGRRGRPSWDLLQRIIGYLNVIWDDAEELERLAELSHPKVTVETAGLGPEATALANRLAETIAILHPDDVRRLLEDVEAAGARAEEEQRRRRMRSRP